MVSLDALGRTRLLELADALEGGRLQPPYGATAVGRYAPGVEREPAVAALRELTARGLGPEAIGVTLRLVAQERLATQALRDRVELVWTDEPSRRAPGARSTSTVVRSLFAAAEREVIVVSYALDVADKARGLFEPLVQRMQQRPELDVRLLVNVMRPWGDERSEHALLAAFAEAFVGEQWPEEPRPLVYYDPRALRPGRGPRACLHAKCVVVDGARALVTSANFTEAAHERNVEAGVLVSDAGFVAALHQQLVDLWRDRSVLRVPGL